MNLSNKEEDRLTKAALHVLIAEADGNLPDPESERLVRESVSLRRRNAELSAIARRIIDLALARRRAMRARSLSKSRRVA